MKKIIETDLVSIAHKILQMKEKSDVNNLLVETEKLYQKLILLKFYEENKFRLDPQFSDENLIKAYDQSNEITSDVKETEEKSSFDNGLNFMTNDIINDLIEDSKNDDIIGFDAIIDEDDVVFFEDQLQQKEEAHLVTDEVVEESKDDYSSQVQSLQVDATPLEVDESDKTENEENTFSTSEEIVTTQETQSLSIQDDFNQQNTESELVVDESFDIDPIYQINHEELFEALGENPQIENPQIEKIEIEKESIEENKLEDTLPPTDVTPSASQSFEVHPSDYFHQVPVNKTINDAFNTTIVIGLNDRIAFEKNLFSGNSEDLNRVISQLNTLDTYQEAIDFIEDLVKPDFNYWKGKEEYEERFMQLVNKRFL